MEKVDEDASLDVKWLKKKSVGKNKGVQFYESFIYDGVKYMLYDCVYMYAEGLQVPHIGKLTKIWECPDKTKKVKVHWFFRPEEISNWIGKTKILEKEILFASGRGPYLAKVNPLEAIAGPCNVVCVSKDCRNPQPSDEEIKAADFIFYRTFNVNRCTILDTMDKEVGGLEIEFVFNRKEGESITPLPESTSERKEENPNATTSIEPRQISVPNKLKGDAKTESRDKDNPNLLKRNTLSMGSDKLQDRPLKKLKPDDKTPPKETPIELEATQDTERSTDMPSKKLKVDISDKLPVDGKSKHQNKLPQNVNNLKPVGTSGTNLEKGKTDKADKGEIMVHALPDDKVEIKELNKTPTGSDKLLDRPFKKMEFDNVNNLKPVGTSGTNLEKGKTNKADIDKIKVNALPDHKMEIKERDKTPTGSDKLLDRPFKKMESNDKKLLKEKEVDLEVAQVSEGMKDTFSKKSMVDSKSKHEDMLPVDVNNLKASVTSGTTENRKNEKTSAKVMDDVEGRVVKKTRDDSSFKIHDSKKSGIIKNVSNRKDFEVNSGDGENKRKLTMSKSVEVSALSTDRDKKTAYQEFVCGPKPNAEKSGWFRRLPWEDRLKSAYDQGTAILLHNVDPVYTSAEVEDIIWHAFNEHCEAKVLQRIAVSSPHYAQALILLKTKDATLKILTKLDEECLMLSNGRPLVGTPCPPLSIKKNSNFFGHLVVDKNRCQNREMDEAVSTSHFSQPNTIEYEMAMDWCVLQSRSNKCWDKFHKQQGSELRNLMADLKKRA